MNFLPFGNQEAINDTSFLDVKFEYAHDTGESIWSIYNALVNQYPSITQNETGASPEPAVSNPTTPATVTDKLPKQMQQVGSEVMYQASQELSSEQARIAELERIAKREADS